MNQLADTFTAYSKEDDVLLNILEATHDGIIVANKQGNIIFGTVLQPKFLDTLKKKPKDVP